MTSKNEVIDCLNIRSVLGTAISERDDNDKDRSGRVA